MPDNPTDRITKEKAHDVEASLQDPSKRNKAMDEINSYLLSLPADERAQQGKILFGTIADDAVHSGQPFLPNLLLVDHDFDSNKNLTTSDLQTVVTSDLSEGDYASAALAQLLLDNFNRLDALDGQVDNHIKIDNSQTFANFEATTKVELSGHAFLQHNTDGSWTYTDSNNVVVAIKDVQIADSGVSFTTINDNHREQHNADGTLLIRDDLGRIISEQDKTGNIVSFEYWGGEADPYKYTQQGVTWEVDHNRLSTTYGTWYSSSGHEKSMVLDHTNGAVTITDDHDLTTKHYLDGHWTRTTSTGAVETLDVQGKLLQVETAGQIYAYENNQIVKIEDKRDQTYWIFSGDGWRHYQSNNVAFDAPPCDLMNYNQVAFENGVQPILQSKDGYSSTTFHADGTSERHYQNGEAITFGADGKPQHVTLPNGVEFFQSGYVLQVSETGAVTVQNSLNPPSESTFTFNRDGSYSIDYSLCTQINGVTTRESVIIQCGPDGYVKYVALPDGTYLNHYPNEVPPWQRENLRCEVETDPTDPNKMSVRHSEDAKALQFNGNVSVTDDGKVLIQSDNSWESERPIFKQTGPQSWSIPLDSNTRELHFANGDYMVMGNTDYPTVVHYSGVDIAGLVNGELNATSVITLPDRSVIRMNGDKWYHDVNGVLEEVTAPQLDSNDHLIGLNVTQGGYRLQTADGRIEFFLPDHTKVTAHTDGKYYTDNGKLYADVIQVTPAGQIVIGLQGFDQHGQPTLTLRGFNGTTWSDPTISRLDFAPPAGTAMLTSTIDAIKRDPAVLLNELKSMTVADQLILDQAYFKSTGHHLAEVASTLNHNDATEALTILSRTSDQTDFVGQMHRVMVLMETDPKHGEQALLNLFLTGTKEEIDQMRVAYRQIYGMDPIDALLQNPLLTPSMEAALPMLEQGVDVLLSGRDSSGRPCLTDDSFDRLLRIAVQNKDIDLFGVVFQFSTQTERARFADSDISKHLNSLFSGNDLTLAQDYAKDGFIRIDTLVHLDIHPFYIDQGLIFRALENAPAEQRELYRHGLSIIQGHQDWAQLSGDARLRALNEANLSQADRSAVDFYFSVHDALRRASWNENQIIDTGYAESPTDTAKFEDRFLHGRETVISFCLNELKPFLLGIGGSHFNQADVIRHLQTMSLDDWNLLKNEPTYGNELKAALKTMLSGIDYDIACKIVDRMAAATSYAEAGEAGKLHGFDAVLAAHDQPGLSAIALLNLSADDLHKYAANDGGIKTQIDQMIDSLSEPGKSLAKSLLAEIPQSFDSQFHISLDPYQRLLFDQVTDAAPATAYAHLQAFLATTPSQCPSFVLAGASLSNADMNKTFGQLIKELPFHNADDFFSYRTAHVDDANMPQLEALWNLRSRIAEQVRVETGKSFTTDPAMADSFANVITDQLFREGTVPLDFAVGPELSKPALLDVILHANPREVAALLADGNSRLYQLLTPAEREVFLRALSLPGQPADHIELDVVGKLRIYALGFGTLQEANDLLKMFASSPDMQMMLMQEYSMSFHQDGDASKPASDFFVDLVAGFANGDKQKLFEVLMSAPISERAKLLDPATKELLAPYLSSAELEVLIHALNRVKDNPSTPAKLDNAEILRLYALGDLGSSGQDVIQFLNGLNTQENPGARVAALTEYMNSFHNADQSNANPLADLMAKYGSKDSIQLTDALSIHPGDQREMFWDANAISYMKESGWSAFSLWNGAREAMTQAQDQYFADLSRAATTGNWNDPKLAEDLKHLENATTAFTEAKKAFVDNTVNVIGTVAALALAPYVSLPALLAGGTLFNIAAKATGLGNDADLSPRALVHETISAIISYGTLKLGGRITEGIFKDIIESQVVARTLKLAELSEFQINALARAGLTWNTEGLGQSLPKLIELMATHADDATVMDAAKLIVDKMLGTASGTGLTTANDLARLAFRDYIARNLVLVVGESFGEVSLSSLRQFAIAVAAQEATGIPGHILSSSVTTVIDRWHPDQSLGDIFNNAAIGFEEGVRTAPATALSIVAFMGTSQCLGILVRKLDGSFTLTNTSDTKQSYTYTPENSTSQVTVVVEPGQQLALSKGDRLALPAGVTDQQLTMIDPKELSTPAVAAAFSTGDITGAIHPVDPDDTTPLVPAGNGLANLPNVNTTEDGDTKIGGANTQALIDKLHPEAVTYSDPNHNSAALDQGNLFGRDNLVSDHILDGYRDAGDGSSFDTDGNAGGKVDRFTLVVDRANDPKLAKIVDDAKARFANYPPEERAALLMEYVRSLLTPQGASASQLDAWHSKLAEQNVGGEIPLGYFIEKGAGVCIEQATLFKVLADELGIAATLVRGTYNGSPHAWVLVTRLDQNGHEVQYVYDPALGVNGTRASDTTGYALAINGFDAQGPDNRPLNVVTDGVQISQIQNTNGTFSFAYNESGKVNYIDHNGHRYAAIDGTWFEVDRAARDLIPITDANVSQQLNTAMDSLVVTNASGQVTSIYNKNFGFADLQYFGDSHYLSAINVDNHRYLFGADGQWHEFITGKVVSVDSTPALKQILEQVNSATTPLSQEAVPNLSLSSKLTPFGEGYQLASPPTALSDDPNHTGAFEPDFVTRNGQKLDAYGGIYLVTDGNGRENLVSPDGKVQYFWNEETNRFDQILDERSVPPRMLELSANGTWNVPGLENIKSNLKIINGRPYFSAQDRDGVGFLVDTKGSILKFEDTNGNRFELKNSTWSDSNGPVTGTYRLENGRIVHDTTSDGHTQVQNLDGTILEYKYPNGRIDYISANYHDEITPLTDVVNMENQFKTAQENDPHGRAERFVQLVADVDKTLRERNMSEEQIALVMQQIRMLTDPTDTNWARPDTFRMRLNLAELMLYHLKNPTANDQGRFDTCNVTTLETREEWVHPEKMFAFVVNGLRGHLYTYDGRDIALDNSIYAPDGQAADSYAVQTAGGSEFKVDGGRDMLTMLTNRFILRITDSYNNEMVNLATNSIMEQEDISKTIYYVGENQQMAVFNDKSKFREAYDANGKPLDHWPSDNHLYTKDGKPIMTKYGGWLPVTPNDAIYDSEHHLIGYTVNQDALTRLTDGTNPITELKPGMTAYAPGNVPLFARPNDIHYSESNDRAGWVFGDNNTPLNWSNGMPLGAPKLTPDQYLDFNYAITGSVDQPFVIVNNELGARFDQTKFISVKNGAELSAAVTTVQNNGGPAILFVHTDNPPFSAEQGLIPGGGGWHVINVWSVNGQKILYTNQGPSRLDHMDVNSAPTADVLFQATDVGGGFATGIGRLIRGIFGG